MTLPWLPLALGLGGAALLALASRPSARDRLSVEGGRLAVKAKAAPATISSYDLDGMEQIAGELEDQPNISTSELALVRRLRTDRRTILATRLPDHLTTS
jgi:hypothetical protein